MTLIIVIRKDERGEFLFREMETERYADGLKKRELERVKNVGWRFGFGSLRVLWKMEGDFFLPSWVCVTKANEKMICNFTSDSVRDQCSAT